MFWRHYFIVKLNCFILRTSTVAGLGVPIFRVFTVRQMNTYNAYITLLFSLSITLFTYNALFQLWSGGRGGNRGARWLGVAQWV